MKFVGLAVLLVAAAPEGAPVSFGPESVQVGESVVNDRAMQLRETPSGFVLASKGSVEPLGRPVRVSLGPDRLLALEPGVRVSRAEAGYILSVHERRRVELEVAGEKALFVVPVTLELTEAGWKVAGREFTGGELVARRPQQDDVDQNLDQLGNSAKRILTSPGGKSKPKQEPQPRRRANGSRWRWPVPQYFSIYDFATSDAVDSSAVTALLHASPTGF
ncbi:MAG TPA: hypothetical protein VEN81_02125 [Planctomycetota bacterium]|nr:hypothetical protein [Planctomycetota bacterium]